MANLLRSDAPFPRSSTSERVHQSVRAQLASGELKPGDRLLEFELARALGVSRSPVREAFTRLEAEGVVFSKPHRGTFVAPLNANRLRELLDFRLALEELAVRRVAAFDDERDLRELTRSLIVLHESVSSAEFTGAIKSDLEFHLSLISLARNEPLRAAYCALLNEFQLYIRLTTRHYGSIRELATEHETLIKALRDGRVEDAVASIRHHIVHGLEHALEELTQAVPDDQ